MLSVVLGNRLPSKLGPSNPVSRRVPVGTNLYSYGLYSHGVYSHGV